MFLDLDTVITYIHFMFIFIFILTLSDKNGGKWISVIF